MKPRTEREVNMPGEKGPRLRYAFCGALALSMAATFPSHAGNEANPDAIELAPGHGGYAIMLRVWEN